MIGDSVLLECSWPAARLADAVDALLVESGLLRRADLADRSPLASPQEQHPGRWLRAAVAGYRIHCDEISTFYPRLETMLARTHPALLRLGEGHSTRYLLVLGSVAGMLRVLTPERRSVELPVTAVAECLAEPIRAGMPTDIEGCLDRLNLKAADRSQARRSLLDTCLRTVPIRGVFAFRRAHASPWRSLLRADHLPQRLGLFLVLQLVQLGFLLAAWSVVGSGALQDRPPDEWLGTALLCFLSAVPAQLYGHYLAGAIGLDFGVRLKQRLLAGTLNLGDADRSEGIGGQMARVLESETFEAALQSGGILAAAAAVQLITALAVLYQGAGGLAHAALLLLWCALCGVYYRRFFVARSRWGARRLTLSQRMVERMVGHQTRLAQEDRSVWHRDEDRELAAYLAEAEAMDRETVRIQTLQSRGWLIAGFAGLLPALLTDAPPLMPIAVAVGGILLAQQALGQTLVGFLSLVDATVSWRLIKPLLRTSVTGTGPGTALVPAMAAASAAGGTVLEAMDLGFRYPAQSRPVLQDCNGVIQSGSRILLQGPSGSGKSTLARLLAGLDAPQEGLLLARGLDRASLGAGWSRVVSLSPQFHRNHLFSGTLLFNVLLGNEWPPDEATTAEAECVCRELGLADLLDRMPNGIHQVIGETGWQLSHGETTRVQLARALLQQSELVILDENFSALDPQTLEQCLAALDRREQAYLVIAHI